jgi:hypothetical protein
MPTMLRRLASHGTRAGEGRFVHARRLLIALAALALVVWCWDWYLRPLIGPPSAYAKGSERYYLALIARGSLAEKGYGARRLLSLPSRTEYDLTRRIHRRQWGVIRDMMLLALFEMRPAAHAPAVTRLMRREYQDAEGWVKTDDIVDGEYVDFYFDGPGEAALRLLQHGRLSRRAVEILMQYARGYYPYERRYARRVLDLFPGAPPYDPSPQPKTINETPAKTERQTAAVEAWLLANLERLRWSPERRRYEVRPLADNAGSRRVR